MERGTPRIAKERCRIARLPGEQLDQPIGRLRAADARELIADQAMLLVQRVEHVGQGSDGFRRGKQPHRVPGRRRVDDHLVVFRCAGETDNLDQSDELVNARNRQAQEGIHVLPIEPRALFDDVAERDTVGVQPAGERPAGVDFRRVQGAAA